MGASLGHFVHPGCVANGLMLYPKSSGGKWGWRGWCGSCLRRIMLASAGGDWPICLELEQARWWPPPAARLPIPWRGRAQCGRRRNRGSPAAGLRSVNGAMAAAAQPMAPGICSARLPAHSGVFANAQISAGLGVRQCRAGTPSSSRLGTRTPTSPGRRRAAMCAARPSAIRASKAGIPVC